MAGPGNHLMLYRNDLPRDFEAWHIEPGFALGGEEWQSLENMERTSNGPHFETARKYDPCHSFENQLLRKRNFGFNRGPDDFAITFAFLMADR